MKKNKLNSLELGRIVALAVLLLVFLFSFILKTLSLKDFAGAVAAACGILLLVPSADTAIVFPRRWMLIQAGFALTAPFVIFLLGPVWSSAVWLVAVLGPALAGISRHSYLWAAERDLLSQEMPCWEYLLALSKKTLICWMFGLLALSWTGTSLQSVPALVLDILSLSGLFVLLVILLIRSVTNQSLLSSGFESGVMTRVRNTSFLRPVPPQRLNIGQRLLFDKVCQYMENGKPFLKEKFSLAELAREMATNKSFLSKVINSCSGMNFSQFVNSYRVRYAVELFRNNPNLKVSELGMMSGFNSGPSITFAFNLFLGKGPKEWCDEWKNRVKEEDGCPSMKLGEEPLLQVPLSGPGE